MCDEREPITVTSDESKLQMLRHARIRRVKQLLKWLPRKANLERYPILKWFAKAARRRPYLWSFKVSNCTPAFYFGSLIACMPLMGIQIVFAFAAALFLRANLPITIGLQAISNPLTITILYPLNFMIGRRLMDFFGIGIGLNPIMGGMHAVFVGGVVLGLALGAVLDLLYRFMAHEAAKFNLARTPRPPSAIPGESRGEEPATKSPLRDGETAVTTPDS